MSSLTAAHVLEDFIECKRNVTVRVALEALPEELRSMVTKLAALNDQIEECRQSLYKKHTILLRSPAEDGKQISEEARPSILKKIDKDSGRLHDLLDTKHATMQELLMSVEKQLRRYDDELLKQAELTVNSVFPMQDEFSEVPESLLFTPGLDDPPSPYRAAVCYVL